MGGVDILDQLSLYRIFIKSRKWTLRLIFHAIDLAVVNSHLEYRRDIAKTETPEKDILHLLEYKLQLVEELLKIGQSLVRKRGRPSNDSTSSSPGRSRKKILLER